MAAIWIRAVRAPFFTASLVPVLVGVAAAWHDGFAVHYPLLALTAAGVVLAHAAANLANDFFDHCTGNDWLNRHRSAVSGGSGCIQRGELSPRWVLAGSLALFALAGAIGLVLTARVGWPVLVLMLAGGASGFLYTAGAIKLAYRGAGELLVGLNFGLLVVIGTYYVQTGQFGWLPVIASLPVSFLITAVLYINQFPDVEADARVAKNNLVVRLGSARAVYGFWLLVAAPYLSVTLAVIVGALPGATLLVWLTVPLAVRAMATAARHHDQPGLIVPACMLTIAIHMSAGLLLSIGLVVNGILQG